jgi:transglutaminase-like putative cysteine protease
MRFTATLALLAATATTAAAQAPVITPAGDPSVRNDTLYRLAAKPADYPDESYILLLDDGVERYEADGRGVRTFRTVAQVLTQEAVEGWGERSFSYDSSREKLTLNWARVIDAATGRVISDKPVHDQESLAPVASSAPVYTDYKVRRISLGAVAPGTIVDYSYTIETLQPVMPGDFSASWSVHTGVPTLRSRFILDLPASVQPRLRETNLFFARKTREAAGRRIYTWATRDVPKVEGEPFMADSNGVFTSVAASAPVEWAEVGRWYAGLARDHYGLTPAIEARLAEVLKDSRTREDSLRAVHRWVAQDFRYVSLSLGMGGYQPRTPAQVFETQYGDCKDKATLFIALARRMGFAAHPVLLSSGGGVEVSMPGIGQFDHMIAAVEKPGGGYTFLDLTAELTPFGALPPSYQGEFGLLVHDDGTSEQLTFPRDPASANRRVAVITGDLAADGLFNGRYAETVTGGLQYSLRNAFSNKFSQKQKDDLTRALANGVFEGASGDSLVIFDGRDLRAEPKMSVAIRGGRAATSSGGTQIFTVPLPNYGSQGLIKDLEARKARGPRRFPIDVAAVIGPVETVHELRMRLPEGWKARLPESVTANSVFGRYHAEYAQVGRELCVTRTLSGDRGVQPPEAADALIAWLKDVAKDDVRYIVLEQEAAK